MANNIRGITIEIGGDTTKLGDALKDVEKQSKSLSSELGSINKLLKMDPTNTDLLAQKQEVLAKAVETTRAKLDTLKKAEEQVQEQFKRGEVSAEQVRALQREIVATTNKLSSYENASKETSDTLNDLNKKTGLLSKVFKGSKKDTDDASEALDELADSADNAEESAGGLGSTLGGALKGGLTAVTGAVTGIATALVGTAESTREYRTDMGKLETAFETAGHDAEVAQKTYETMQSVLGDSAQAVEATNHLAELCQTEEQLAEWTNIATGVYAKFGASIPIEGLTEASNETAKTGQLTGSLADALNWAGVSEDKFQESLDECNTEQERQALITKTLSGLYSESAEAYRENNAEVIRANEASESLTSSMAQIGETVEPLLTDIKMLGASLLADLVPSITAITTSFRGVMNGDEGATSALGSALSTLISDLLKKAVELAPTLAMIAINLITTLATTLISSLPQLLTTGVQMVMAVVNGLVTAIPQVISALVNMIPLLVTALTTAIPQLIQGAVDLFMALVEAVPLVIPPLIQALPTIIMSIIEGILSAIPQLLEGSLQFYMAIIDAIPLLISELVPEIPTIITTIIEGLIDHLPEMFDGAVFLFMAIVDALVNIGEQLYKYVPTIVTTIVGHLKQLPGKIWSAIIGAVDKMSEWGGKMKEKASSVIKTVADAITEKMEELPGQILEIGSNIVSGLWEGIKGAKDWVVKKISGFAGDVLGSAKDALGIHSPSRVFEKEVGEQIANGLVQGINNRKGYAKKSAEELSEIYVSEAKSKVEQLKLANEMSESEEVAFWESIVASCKVGSKAYEDATVAMLKAKNTLATSVAKLDDTYAKDVSAVKSKLIADIQAVSNAYNKAIQDRQNQITSSMKLFDEFKPDEGIGKEDLTKNLESQVVALAQWDMALDKLASREGMDSGLLEDLQNMGVSSLNTLESLNEMSDEELTRYIALYRAKELIALERSQAEHEALKAESERQIAELTETANTQLNELEQTYLANLKELGVSTKDTSKKIGKDIVKGLKAGIESENAGFQSFLTSYFNSIVSTAKGALQIHSPSRVFANVIGKQIPAGIAQGISANVGVADDAIHNMTDELTRQAMGLNSFDRRESSIGPGVGDNSALLSKLDGIYERLNRLQIVLDTGTLVGETIDKIDAGLASNQLLHARGV